MKQTATKNRPPKNHANAAGSNRLTGLGMTLAISRLKENSVLVLSASTFVGMKAPNERLQQRAQKFETVWIPPSKILGNTHALLGENLSVVYRQFSFPIIALH